MKIDILFIVYPNMAGVMSRLMGVPVGEYPFFENAMSRGGCDPAWGGEADVDSMDGWLEGLRGRENRLYLSIGIDKPEDTPEWCGSMRWNSVMDELIGNAEKVVMIDRSKTAFLYNEIESRQGDQEAHDSYLSKWKELKKGFDSLKLKNGKIKRFNMESFGTRKGVEVFYRGTGIRVAAITDRAMNNQETKRMVAETMERAEKIPKTNGEIPAVDLTAFAERFAVCVSAHPAYLDLVPALLDEWDRQIGDLPIIKVVLYDYNVVPEFKEGWDVIFPVKAYGQPSPLRNRALEMDVDWIQYWDADNMPEPNHFKPVFEQAYWAAQNVGLIYHETIGADGTSIVIPENGDPRMGYFIDTASCWRREAVMSAGCWQSDILVEDWTLARDIYLAGWKFEKSSVVFKWQNTAGNRTSTGFDAQSKWDSRDFSIVILFRGDDHFLECVKADLDELEIPPHCSITIVTDGDKAFHKKVNEWLTFNSKNNRFERKTVFASRKQCCPINRSDEFIKIHTHVADLYSRALRATPDELILFWEDDVRPEPGAFRALSDQMATDHNIACCGAPYMVRGMTYLAAARKKDYWDDPIPMNEITDEPMNVGMLAGGFTLYNRVALEECPMLGPLNIIDKEGFLGWDGFLCKRMNEAGWQIQLCGKSKVKHLPK